MKNSFLTRIIKINNLQWKRSIVNNSKFVRPLILGIETSCDDTGSGLVDRNGNVLGEAICSQQETHLRYGGIIPPIAQDLHRKNIENVIKDTFQKAKLNINDIDAIAVTNRPGLPLSLQVGTRYAKYLARNNSKPIIPIHHMEAHALMAKMEYKFSYPFLTLLCSGGHCVIAYVQSFNEFYMLGETLDDAPGEALDKIARRLKIRNIPEYQWISGGQAIESAAIKSKNSKNYEFPLPLARQKNCMFSFAGLKNTAQRYIQKDEVDFQLGPDDVIPNYQDFCNSFQRAIVRHISYRTQRALEFCDRRNFFQNIDKKVLVISGGCASNNYLYTIITEMAKKYDFITFRPSRKYCTDNGVMIAWNGVERFVNNSNVINDFNLIDVTSRSPFSKKMLKDVEDASINCKWIQLPKKEN